MNKFIVSMLLCLGGFSVVYGLGDGENQLIDRQQISDDSSSEGSFSEADEPESDVQYDADGYLASDDASNGVSSSDGSSEGYSSSEESLQEKSDTSLDAHQSPVMPDPLLLQASPTTSSDDEKLSHKLTDKAILESESNESDSSESSDQSDSEVSDDSCISSESSDSDAPAALQDNFIGLCGEEVCNLFDDFLKALYKFHFNAMPKKVNQLDDLFERFIDFLRAQSTLGESAYIYFKESDIRDLTEWWADGNFAYENIIHIRHRYKDTFFELLSELKNIFLNLKKECADDAISNVLNALTKVDSIFSPRRCLDIIYSFNFQFFKRSDKDLENFFNLLSEFFLEYSDRIGFPDFEANAMVRRFAEWDQSKCEYLRSRNAKADLKTMFFDALMMVEEVMEFFYKLFEGEDEACRKIAAIQQSLIEVRKRMVERLPGVCRVGD